MVAVRKSDPVWITHQRDHLDGMAALAAALENTLAIALHQATQICVGLPAGLARDKADAARDQIDNALQKLDGAPALIRETRETE